MNALKGYQWQAMAEELSASGVRRLKTLRDQAQETHKTAGDASAHVHGDPDLQPTEEWRFRWALRENADGLLDLAELGLQTQELALSLRALANAPVKKGGREYAGAIGHANMVLRAYERKARLAAPPERSVEETAPTF